MLELSLTFLALHHRIPIDKSHSALRMVLRHSKMDHEAVPRHLALFHRQGLSQALRRIPLICCNSL
jgi:hypothetical protein